jgi:hypothetical protein
LASGRPGNFPLTSTEVEVAVLGFRTSWQLSIEFERGGLLGPPVFFYPSVLSLSTWLPDQRGFASSWGGILNAALISVLCQGAVNLAVGPTSATNGAALSWQHSLDFVRDGFTRSARRLPFRLQGLVAVLGFRKGSWHIPLIWSGTDLLGRPAGSPFASKDYRGTWLPDQRGFASSWGGILSVGFNGHRSVTQTLTAPTE